MLKELYIENLAVIRSAVIPFSGDFNVFTGETGAGKSILINGINAVLGQRMTKDIVRNGSNKATVTALFTNLSESVELKLDELGISFDDDEITITREISADGGSVARINNRTTTISVLREIGNMLINIHGQHDNQILMAPERHISILDSFSGDYTYLQEYREAFRELQSAARKLSELKKTYSTANDRAIYLEAIIDEIEPLGLEPGEDALLEEEYIKFRNSADIIRGLSGSAAAIDSDEECAVSVINDAESMLESITEFYPEALPLRERLTSAKIELSDIAAELSHNASSLDINEERFSYISSRRDTINHIKKKYNREINEIIELCTNAKSELSAIECSSENIEKLSAEREKLLENATEKAKILFQHRSETAQNFISRVTEELRFLDMPDVIIDIRHDKGKLSINGMDSIEILISANRGEVPKPISKIASGGELSRIMLALKTVIADKDDIPTLIFDEIDTGVSGRAAQKIGIKLQEISAIRQVLCVTHLAQIAVMADNHLLIEKKPKDDRTVTEVIQLGEQDRIKEIARIIGGESSSELMLKNAEEMINTNRRK